MKSISIASLRQYQQQFDKNPHNRVLQRAVMANGVYKASRNPAVVAYDKNAWSYEIPTGDIGDQKSTGTCWLMAALVLAEKSVTENLKSEPVKLSKSYLYFYDKLEMANAFLQKMIDLRDEPLESNHVQYLLREKQSDGGWWFEAADLIGKYGVVPTATMPDTEDSMNSASINQTLNERLAYDAKKLREAANPQAAKDECLAEIYQLLTLSFGTPPQEFTFDYMPKPDDKGGKKDTKEKDDTSKNKKDLHTIHTTPQEFWKKYGTELTDFVTLEFMRDRKRLKWDTLYETDGVEFMYGNREQALVTRFSPAIEKAVKQQLLGDEPVWFAWDVSRQFSSKLGIMDADLWKYNDVYGIRDELDADERGLYQDYNASTMHATAIIGFREENGIVTHWKVKNSWGKERGQDGYVSMNANYLQKYVTEATLRKKYLPKTLQAIAETKPTTVRYWE